MWIILPPKMDWFIRVLYFGCSVVEVELRLSLWSLVPLAPKPLRCYTGNLWAKSSGEVEDTAAMSGEWVSNPYQELLTVFQARSWTRSHILDLPEPLSQLPPFYRCGNWGNERLIVVLKVTQPVGGRASIWFQAHPLKAKLRLQLRDVEQTQTCVYCSDF